MAPPTYDPATTTVMRTLAPGLTTFSMPFLRFGKIRFGIRCCVVTLSSGSLLVYGPVPLSPLVTSTLPTLGNGKVAYIVAPDIEHHMSIGPWKQQFPEARVIGPEGLREKRAKQGNEDVPIDYIFTKGDKAAVEASLPEEVKRDVEVEYMDGHANQEICFFHKPTKSLLAADVIFNLPVKEQWSKVDPPTRAETDGSWILNKITLLFTSAHGSRQRYFVDWILAKDKASVKKSVERMLGWGFERVVVAHGEVIETGGSTILRKVYGGVLGK